MADTKISALVSLASASDNDLLVIVSDPSGTPVTKKITLSALLAAVARKDTTFGVVLHNDDPNVARPPGYAVVYWIGSVDPVNKAVGDIVLNTSLPAPYTASDADSAATADKLVLRDAAGRAQVTDPAVAADIATKGYVDTAVAGVGGGGGGLPFTRFKITGAESLVLPGILISGSSSTLTLVSGPLRTYSVPIDVEGGSIQVDSFHIEVVTALAGLFEAAIYARDANGVVTGPALVTSGQLDVSTTGEKSGITAATVLAEGKYVIQFRANVNVGLRAFAGSPGKGSVLTAAWGTSLLYSTMFDSGSATFGTWDNPGIAPSGFANSTAGLLYPVALKVTPQ